MKFRESGEAERPLVFGPIFEKSLPLDTTPTPHGPGQILRNLDQSRVWFPSTKPLRKHSFEVVGDAHPFEAANDDAVCPLLLLEKVHNFEFRSSDPVTPRSHSWNSSPTVQQPVPPASLSSSEPADIFSPPPTRTGRYAVGGWSYAKMQPPRDGTTLLNSELADSPLPAGFLNRQQSPEKREKQRPVQVKAVSDVLLSSRRILKEKEDDHPGIDQRAPRSGKVVTTFHGNRPTVSQPGTVALADTTSHAAVTTDPTDCTNIIVETDLNRDNSPMTTTARPARATATRQLSQARPLRKAGHTTPRAGARAASGSAANSDWHTYNFRDSGPKPTSSAPAWNSSPTIKGHGKDKLQKVVTQQGKESLSSSSSGRTNALERLARLKKLMAKQAF